jgi:predicted amidohydrolase
MGSDPMSANPEIPVREEHWRSAVLVLAACLVGWVAWSGEVLTLPVVLLLPALWAASPSRTVAAAVAAGYFLAASRGLPQGAAEFFGSSVWIGFVLWIAAAMPFVAVHALLWTKWEDRRWKRRRRPRAGRGRNTPLRYGVIMVLMAVPPCGITGWAHPITATGVLLPGWGWWGLGATAFGLCAMTTRLAPVVALAAVVATAISAADWSQPSAPEGWRGVDTAVGAAFGRADAFDQQRSLIAHVWQESAEGVQVIVLPESALGILTPTVERLWGEALADLHITVIAGAAVINTEGYDTVMVALDRRGARILYRERMPVPVAMWQPWRSWFSLSGGASGTFFSAPFVEVAGQRIAPLICYEQLLVWPVLQSAFHRPDRIVAIANGWWAKDTSIPAIQRTSVEAWARLFDLPVVNAFNR